MHDEIDEAANCLKLGDWRQARWLLERIRDRKGYALDPVETYRVLANLGHTYEYEGKYNEAATLFLQAASHIPDDERSMVRIICAHSYLGEDDAACIEAEKLHNKYPEIPDGQALWVRTTPESKSYEDILLPNR